MTYNFKVGQKWRYKSRIYTFNDFEILEVYLNKFVINVLKIRDSKGRIFDKWHISQFDELELVSDEEEDKESWSCEGRFGVVEVPKHLERWVADDLNRQGFSTRNATTTGGTNPKDIVGSKKANLLDIPLAPLFKLAEVQAYAKTKYPPFNWRDKSMPVRYSPYLNAAIRHIFAYADGENVASDSKLHHLDHAIEGLLILRDAQLNGNAIDDRIKGSAAKVLEEVNESLARGE